MRLFVNALSLSNEYGIGRYTRTMLHGLSKIDRGGWSVYAYGRKASLEILKQDNGIIPVNALHPEISRLLLEQMEIPAVLSRIKPRAYLSPDYTLPQVLPVKRKLVTVHDLLVFTQPESISPKARLLYRTFMPRALAQADVILADSKATAGALAEHFPTHSAKAEVLYPAISPEYSDGKPLQPRTAMPAVFPEKFRTGEAAPKFIMYVGSGSSRKNLAMLTQCFADWRAQTNFDGFLILIGGDGTRTSQNCGVLDAGYQPGDSLKWCYENALGLALISSGEGFGYPVLEALACGCPVLISRNSAMGEIPEAGRGAVECDPSNSADVTLGIEALVSETERLKSEIDSAKIREKFSAERFARHLLDICDGL